MITEADTCRQYVLPKLYSAGWTDDLIREQKTFTDGRILVNGRQGKRGKQKRVDYLLYSRRDLPLAVVEAKAAYLSPGQGLQQAIDYAVVLDLPFAYSTNGKGIVEHDLLTGQERDLDAFPAREELQLRLRVHRGLPEGVEDRLLTPYHLGDRVPRYYQTIAIQRAAEAILRGDSRLLLTLATGTGKTEIAFQIAWKLWQGRWNRAGEYRRTRILFLADRSILVDDPKDKAFAPFGDARHKIEGGVANTTRAMYFSTYQALAEDEARPGLYRWYPPDFFDLIVVDEAHRGSAGEESSWRTILEHFSPAAQLGMTATPLREDTRDTYAYYGQPIYTYSLAQGIQDGFLAPYSVRRIITDVDAAGWRPTPGQQDAYGREIPDGEYGTKDFEASLSLLPRTEAVARHLCDYLRKTDPLAKTLVFCVDQEHALQMRSAIARQMPDLMKQHPDYVARVVADEGGIGKGFLSKFQDVDQLSPVILTTSRLLSTGVDAPTVKNVVLFRVVGSMAEFKQIIGRGTRVREDYGKLFFTILDYTGSATQKFADPDFDGLPISITEVTLTADGETEAEQDLLTADPPFLTGQASLKDDDEGRPRKFLIRDGVTVSVLHETVQELDAHGRQLRTVEFTSYAAEQVRSLYMTADDFRHAWADPRSRESIVDALEEHGVSLEHLEQAMGHEEASDPFDLLCSLAFNAPLLTRRQRAEAARKRTSSVYAQYSGLAATILDQLLDQYAEHGIDELSGGAVFRVLPATRHINLTEIGKAFGGVDQLRQVVASLPAVIYA